MENNVLGIIAKSSLYLAGLTEFEIFELAWL